MFSAFCGWHSMKLLVELRGLGTSMNDASAAVACSFTAASIWAGCTANNAAVIAPAECRPAAPLHSSREKHLQRSRERRPFRSAALGH
jgi:hypothetical protein